MDSTNPYSQCSSLVGLLNSQQEASHPDNSPYESYPYTMNFGSSEIPAFSSQQSQGPSVAEGEKKVERNKERRRWSPVDDEVLISAWLNTSKDVIVAYEQKSGNFWKRVGEYFAASPHGQQEGEKRGMVHCRQRWHKINELTNKFYASFAAAERQKSSGHSETDVLKMAHAIYQADYKQRFVLDHAWCLLRYEQKWLQINTPKVNEGYKRKCVEDGSQASSCDVGDPDKRPEGVKAAKGKRNSVMAEYKDIWDIKMADLAMKEKLSKLA